jgi:ADP-heptose:LPS heptosyltransferase
MIVYSNFGGLGDALLVQSIALQKAKEIGACVGVAHPYPELIGASQEIRHIAVSPTILKAKHALLRLKGKQLVETPMYYSKHFANDKASEQSILNWMSARAGLVEPLTKPFIPYISAKEDILKELGLWDTNYLIVQSQAKKDSPQKQYPMDKLKSVVARLKVEIFTIQIGQAADEDIGSDLDLRGRTSLKALMELLKNSKGLLGLVSFPMHLQAALEGDAVIIYGGSELPVQSGYPTFDNIFSHPECSPCWSKSCPYDLKCMKEIGEQVVVDACMKMIKK